ncbi:uncharacterized protein AB675_4729 [Cyphellophora attinorum]|uniref:Uncharacterized protein n=1 Tax=Cyphellophora attinorum TaxID=1664694 RepID=A0A0N1HNP6_9EURO|nr:uncharacterized protein AB675_4729 [Phialophora attinorum]KPI39200.1 hypothetical protein AB675_4729 [Phialophora attinorum]
MTPPAKRTKVEIKESSSPTSRPRFAVGDKVYKTGLQGTGRMTAFKVTEMTPGEKEWAYTVENKDFLGEGTVMVVPETQLYTVNFKVEDTSGKSSAVAKIVDWGFDDVERGVGYLLEFDKIITRYDPIPESVQVGEKGKFYRSGHKAKVISRNGEAFLATEFVTPNCAVTEDKLGEPLK